MRRVIAAGFVIVATAIGGCAPKPNYLFIEPSSKGARVELRTTVGVFRKTEMPVPLADCGFYALPDSGAAPGRPPEEIWRVMALSPDVAVLGVDYGIVPPGFTQVTPVAGAPTSLEPGGRYAVECTGDALGVTEFRMPK